MLLVAPMLSGCLMMSPGQAPHATEAFTILVAPHNLTAPYILDLPALLFRGALAAPTSLLTVTSGNATVAPSSRDNRTIIRVSGQGNASFGSQRELSDNSDFAEYAWSTPPPPVAGAIGPRTVEVYREAIAGSNGTIHVDVQFDASWSGRIDFHGRDALFRMDVAGSDAWQSFVGSDQTAVS